MIFGHGYWCVDDRRLKIALTGVVSLGDDARGIGDRLPPAPDRARIFAEIAAPYTR
jgi:hypothetical protein